MWMSATVDERSLATIDHPSIDSLVELGDDDRTGHLARRLNAVKAVRRIAVDPDPKRYGASLAAQLLELHQPGTRTIAVLNTVERARTLRAELERAGAPDVVLLHSRFRPGDRARRTSEALAEIDPEGPGRIVVSTQVLEAGVDLSSSVLFTEAAPWPSVVQRAGRCNRDGDASGATLAWSPPPKAAPYEEADVAAAASELTTLESQALTATDMGARSVAVAEVVHPVLRRRDLLGLFDTTPDLSGNDVDVARFIRSVDDIDVLVAWRPLTEAGPEGVDPAPTRHELCPVPIGEVRSLLKKGRAAWRFDHLQEGWSRCGPGDLRPGQVVVLRSAEGGYEPQAGWDPSSRTPVQPLEGDEPEPGAQAEEGTGADTLTFAPGTWVPLIQHLAEVDAAVRELYAALGPPGLSPAHGEAAAVAGRLHDLGKAHPCFQQMLLATIRHDHERPPETGQPWAKSGGSGRSHHQRRYFRHELASALALLGGASPALDGLEEPDLAVFLVGAHHGKVRVGIRSLPDEPSPPDAAKRFALGVWDGDVLPEVDVPGQRLPSAVLDLGPMELGDQDDGRPSWSRSVLGLRDRGDLGPFRLAFLEAVVRLADWRMSAAQEGGRR
jgi:CRISPR-associated endonuclease/helicase Cas3